MSNEENGNITIKVSLDSDEFKRGIDDAIECAKKASQEIKNLNKLDSITANRIFESILKQVETGHSVELYDPLDAAKQLEKAAIYLGLSEALK